MHRLPQKLAFIFTIALASTPSLADCWRLPDGRIVSTAATSSPPVAKAVRVSCPPSAPSTPQSPISKSGTVPQKPAPQQVADPCAPYYGKGYCTDYIAQRMGRRPSGDPRTWPLNRDLSQIREGVAVIFAGVTSAGHVAYVERVIRDAKRVPVSLEVSEMNYARGTRVGTPPSCLVTNNFGVVSRRTFPIAGSGASGFWQQ